MNVSISGFGYPSSASFMKFVLTYDGSLKSRGSSKRFAHKWAIRQYIHPQLVQLWRVHPALTGLMQKVPETGGYLRSETYHTDIGPPANVEPLRENEIHLSTTVDAGGIQFLPLVRKSYALVCSLNITFMRQEAAGRVYQGGDLDNRIKLFLDSMKVPSDECDLVARLEKPPEQPIYCLLEDDELITGLSVNTTRLLSESDKPEDYVRLVIDVDVRVTHPRAYNSTFLGD